MPPRAVGEAVVKLRWEVGDAEIPPEDGRTRWCIWGLGERSWARMRWVYFPKCRRENTHMIAHLPFLGPFSSDRLLELFWPPVKAFQHPLVAELGFLIACQSHNWNTQQPWGCPTQSPRHLIGKHFHHYPPVGYQIDHHTGQTLGKAIFENFNFWVC